MKKSLLLLALLLSLVVSCKKKVESEIEKSTNFLDNTTETLPFIDNETISLSENGSVIKNADIPDNDTYFGDIEISSDNNTETNKQIDELCSAISNSDMKKVSSLIETGINLNQVNREGNTPLSIAINKSDINTVKFLLSNGADVNFPITNGYTPLSLAIMNKDNAMIDELLDVKNIDLYAVHNNFWNANPIYVSIQKGCISCIHKLVNKGFDLNHDFSKYDATPILIYAIESKDYMYEYETEFNKLFDALLIYKANINVSDNNNESPLYRAIENKDFKSSLKLICLGADYKFTKDNVSLKDMMNSIEEKEYSKYESGMLSDFKSVLSIITEKENVKNIEQCKVYNEIDNSTKLDNGTILDNKTKK